MGFKPFPAPCAREMLMPVVLPATFQPFGGSSQQLRPSLVPPALLFTHRWLCTKALSNLQILNSLIARGTSWIPGQGLQEQLMGSNGGCRGLPERRGHSRDTEISLRRWDCSNSPTLPAPDPALPSPLIRGSLVSGAPGCCRLFSFPVCVSELRAQV